MDEVRYNEALKHYNEKDYRAAAKGFLAAAGRGIEGNGLAYHMAGNSLLKLRRYTDAITVYGHALRDETYMKTGAVHANLATAHSAQGDYQQAVTCFREALADVGYTQQYRALQGMAAALLQMGKVEEAAASYRQAALDADNPDPGKALNNLGLCFMALGRPADAAEAYKAALGFDTYSSRGKALANLGMAFSALGEHKDALKSFEKAVELHSFKLGPAALAAMENSRAVLEEDAIPKREIVEGWRTGELDPVAASAQVTGPLDAADLPSQAGSAPLDSLPIVGDEEDGAETAEGDVSAFFARTDEEMKLMDRAESKRKRNEKAGENGPWRRVVTIVSIIVVVAGLAAALYFAGYGFPTQIMTVGGMLEAHAEGLPVEGYWVAVPSADVAEEMAKLPPIQGHTIQELERSAARSYVKITVTPRSGEPLRYEITMLREGVGWRVSGIANRWSTPADRQ